MNVCTDNWQISLIDRYLCITFIKCLDLKIMPPNRCQISPTQSTMLIRSEHVVGPGNKPLLPHLNCGLKAWCSPFSPVIVTDSILTFTSIAINNCAWIKTSELPEKYFRITTCTVMTVVGLHIQPHKGYKRGNLPRTHRRYQVDDKEGTWSPAMLRNIRGNVFVKIITIIWKNRHINTWLYS